MSLFGVLYCPICFKPIRLPFGSRDGVQTILGQPSPYPPYAQRNQTIHAVQVSVAEFLDAVWPG
jgi:hypothetical protein